MGWLALGYLGATAILFAFHSLIFSRPRAELARVFSGIFNSSDRATLEPSPTRNTVAALNSGLIALTGIIVSQGVFDSAWLPLGTAIVAAGLAILGVLLRHWIPMAAGAIVLVYAHTRLWKYGAEPAALDRVGGNAMGGAGLTLGGAAVANLRENRDKGTGKEGVWGAVEYVAHALWIVSVQTVFYKTCSADLCCLLSVAFSLALAFALMAIPAPRLGDFSALPMALGAVGFVYLSLEARQTPAETVSHWMLWSASAGAFGFACLYKVVRPLQSRLTALKNDNLYQWVHLTIAGLIGVFTLISVYDNASLMLAYGLAAVFVALLTRWPGLKPAPLLAVCYATCAHVLFYGLLEDPPPLPGRAFLFMSLGVAAITLSLSVVVGRTGDLIDLNSRIGLQWLGAFAALSLCVFVFYHEPGWMQNYISAFWGVSAISILLTGFVFRAKPLRWVGIAGMGVCIPRILFWDIHDTKYRIIAFMVVAVALLTVSFLYSKFHEQIERWDDRGEDAEDQNSIA